MDIKLFKGFTAYRNTTPYDIAGNLAAINDKMAGFQSNDPGPTTWRDIGFMPMEDGYTFIMDMTGAGHICGLAFNERNLPGAVIKEAVLEQAREIERRDGRKVGKKAFAELKEQVIATLLPKAFIRRKVVPIMFIKDFVLIFSTSAKVCDDAISMIVGGAFGPKEFSPALIENLVTQEFITNRLTEIARDGQTEMVVMGDGQEEYLPYLEIYNLAILKGEDKQTITVKDKDIGSTDIQELLKQDYHVTKLGVKYCDAGNIESSASFILNDKLVFSKFLLLDKVEKNSGDDEAAVFNSVSWMTAKMALAALDCVIGVMGGLQEIERGMDDSGATDFDQDDSDPAADEDDEDEI